MQQPTPEYTFYLQALNTLLKEGHSVRIKAGGRSMQPFIEPDRDELVLTPGGEYAAGDIVLADVGGGRAVIHRILRIEGKQVTLQGDGNVGQQEHCRTDDIHAKLTAIVHPTRTVDTASRSFRLLSRLWTSLRPLRRYLLAVYRRWPGKKKGLHE